MTAEEKYVAAAYLVVFVFVLLYLLLISTKLARLERDVGELVERAREREAREREEPEVLGEVRRGHG